MAYIKSLLKIRRIAMVTLVFVCWSTKVPPKMNWINEEFNYALRKYEFTWQINLPQAEVTAWQARFFKGFLEYWDEADTDSRARAKAAIARGARR